ncbi:MAG: DUF3144 domain-containing protein [Steroidobacteraceae bacterium]
MNDDTADDAFYERADSIIHLANEQLAEVERGEVSASLMYATARFNAWVTACGFHGAEEMQATRQQTIDYFVEQYRAMLVENLDDYAANFDTYMRPTTPDA